MFYQALVTREDNYWLAEFPDCPGCQTFEESEQGLLAMATEAVEGWLESHLLCGRVPPAPGVHQGENLMRVGINPVLAARIQIRIARHAAGLTQQGLAELAGVSQQQIAKLEHPDLNPSITTLAKVATALGMVLDIRFEKAA